MRVFACLFLLAGIAQAADPEIAGPAEVKPGGFAKLSAGAGLPVVWDVRPEPVQSEEKGGEITFTGDAGVEYTVTAVVFDFKAGSAAKVKKVVKFLAAGAQQIPPVIPQAKPSGVGVVPRPAPSTPTAAPLPSNDEVRKIIELYRKAKEPENVSAAPPARTPPQTASAAAPFVNRPEYRFIPATNAVRAVPVNTSSPASTPMARIRTFASGVGMPGNTKDCAA